MAEQLHAGVVVVGADPVVLTLAMDLALRGVDVIVLESRAPGEPPGVKSNHVSARSMEIFRRLGVAQKVRNAGLPADYLNDVVYRSASNQPMPPSACRLPIRFRASRWTMRTQ
jgi:2-polyprenyl-6-methoxyphenol hydroxylase-like FAD-dependent oxidoreductase